MLRKTIALAALLILFLTFAPAVHGTNAEIPAKTSAVQIAPDTLELVEALRLDRMSETLRVLTKDIGPRYVGGNGAVKARDFLIQSLHDLGFNQSDGTMFVQSLTSFDRSCENVVAVLPGANENAGMLVVSAHYDSALVGEGSIDNGSGVAILLEMARVFAEAKPTFPCEIQLAFLTAEEEGYHGAYDQSGHR